MRSSMLLEITRSLRTGLVAASLLAPAALHGQTPSQRVAIATAALEFVRAGSKLGVNSAPADSVLVELRGAFADSSDHPAERAAMGKRLRARTANRLLWSCSDQLTVSGRSRRAECAVAKTQYYLEVDNVELAGKAASGMVWLFKRSPDTPADLVSDRISLSFTTFKVEVVEGKEGWRPTRLLPPY